MKAHPGIWVGSKLHQRLRIGTDFEINSPMNRESPCSKPAFRRKTTMWGKLRIALGFRCTKTNSDTLCTEPRWRCMKTTQGRFRIEAGFHCTKTMPGKPHIG